MAHKTHYVNEINQDTARVNLFGVIGSDINGHYLAQDLLYLGEKVGQIDLFINSEGGSVFHGLSIISAIQSTPANITAYIEGMALSMAGVIAVACNQVKMADFSRLMAHDPNFGGAPGRNAKQKKALENIKATLVKIFENNTNKSAADLDALMARETWLTPEEALEAGFIDEIYSTGKKVKISNEMAIEEIVNIYKNLNSKNDEMKNLTNILGLDENSSQEVIENKIQELKDGAAGFQTQIDNLETENQTLADTNASLEGQVETLTNQVAVAAVKNAIALGKASPEKEAELVEIAKKDLQAFNSLMEMVPSKAPKIENQIQGGNAEERKDWTFDNWQKQDPAGLAEMQKNEPAKFEKLFNAYTQEA